MATFRKFLTLKIRTPEFTTANANKARQVAGEIFRTGLIDYQTPVATILKKVFVSSLPGTETLRGEKHSLYSVMYEVSVESPTTDFANASILARFPIPTRRDTIKKQFYLVDRTIS